MFTLLRLVEAAATLGVGMNQKLVTIPYCYRIGFVPKGKRKPIEYDVSTSMTVALADYDEADAPRIVALWRPRPDEYDGQVVEIRHDCRRFLVPVFPHSKLDTGGPLEGNERRLSGEQLVSSIADPAVSTRFFRYAIVAPDVPRGDKVKVIPEAELTMALGLGQIKWDNKAAMESGLAALTDRFVLIGGRPFHQVCEPLIKIDSYRPLRIDDVYRYDQRQVSVLLDWSEGEPFHFEGGTYLFRLTNADRAAMRVHEMKRDSARVVNANIDLEVRDPTVFGFDDINPAVGGELVAAGRQYLNHGHYRPSTDPRREELHKLLVVEDQYSTSFGTKYRSAHWDDPGLPRAAEVLRALLDDGLVDEACRERVATAVQAYEGLGGTHSLSALDEELLGAISL
ncbi:MULTISPECIES: hypothetical protein [unclassified Bradyrhizobium]